jgi:DnaJ family protein C protein 11/ATP-dependent RNA helicase DDX10/DBP4
MAGLKAGLEVGHKHKTIAEISEAFDKARAKEARKTMEATLNFRGSYGFSFSAAHLVDAEIAQRRAAIAAHRGATLSPLLDLNGMDFNSVFDVPLTEKDTAFVGAQGQMARGMGAGGLILGVRRQCSEHTGVELAVVTGSTQSQASLAVSRVISEHTAGTLTYSYSPVQGGLGLEVGVQRQLSAHAKGHLTWILGPTSGLSTGMQP